MKKKALTGLLGVLLLSVAAPFAYADVRVPDAYRVVTREQVTAGVEHLELVRNDPRQVVNVAGIIPGAPVSLRGVLSNGQVAGPAPRLERTSAMCLRVRCLVAVNGDFYIPNTGEPLGAVVIFGELARSPNLSHHQLTVGRDGTLSAGPLDWNATLAPTDLRSLEIDGVNVTRQADQIVLYTPRFGPATETNPFGAELVAEVVRPPGPVLIGQTALVRLVELKEGVGDTPIPSTGMVLSGHGDGAKALAELWSRVNEGKAASQALLRIESEPEAAESVGATPILVRDGKPWFSNDPNNFVRGLHPRTIVGWNASGEVLLVTVDGRQPGYSRGMSLAEAADLMIGLGATEAINLDGGGSTTFVVNGQVLNRPSDRAVRRNGDERIVNVPARGDVVLGNVERPVVNALVVVARESVPPPADPLAGGLELPRPLALAAPTAGDPGSNPAASLPALVVAEPEADSDLVRVATLLVFAVALGHAVAVIRREGRSRT